MPENYEIKFIKGKNLYLRPLTKDDIPTMLKWINDPEVTKYLSVYLPVTEKEEEEWVENMSRSKDSIVLAIMAKESTTDNGIELTYSEFIGTMGLHNINWKDRTAITGALIGEKKYWGKGYGTEAKMFLLNYAFNTLNLRKICSTVLGYNERSKNYNLKCGYEIEGIRKEQVFKDGAYVDEILMAVFKENWLLLWEKFKNEKLR